MEKIITELSPNILLNKPFEKQNKKKKKKKISSGFNSASF